MSSASSGPYQEFKVVFDGIQLPPDAVDRIDQAIQKAVQEALAQAQIPTTSIRPLRDALAEQELVGGHQTAGIYVQ